MYNYTDTFIKLLGNWRRAQDHAATTGDRFDRNIVDFLWSRMISFEASYCDRIDYTQVIKQDWSKS